MKKAKSIQASKTVLSEVMMPIHANHYGSLHGGTILTLVDEAAFVAASKHARSNVVIASMDHILFKQPVNIGDLLIVKAQLCYVGKSSMEVEVEVEAEKLKEGKVIHIGSAYITMVALDENGKQFKLTTRNIPARVIQHEIDHLNGKLITDEPR